MIRNIQLHQSSVTCGDSSFAKELLALPHQCRTGQVLHFETAYQGYYGLHHRHSLRSHTSDVDHWFAIIT